MEIVPRVLSPLTFVILARILAPQDFGVLAIAQVAISFCYLFWDAGLEKALIQTKESLDEAANIVFWINLGLGFLIYGVLFLTAPLLANFFNSPASCDVLKVLGLQIFIGSLSTVQVGLFLRKLDFKKLFWARLANSAIPAFVSIPLAYLGYGVWALVASSLAGALINMIILWLQSPWRPKFSFDMAVAREMGNFGIWVIFDSFIGWFISQGDAVVIGRYLGVKDLGIYRTGRNMIDIVFALTLNPIQPILYPAFSALHRDKAGLQSFLHKTNRILMALSLPIGTGIMCIASPLVAVVLGAKWQGVEVVLSIMGLQMSLGWLIGANPEIYRAMGRPDVQSKIGIITIPLYLIVYFLAAPLGLRAFVLARLGLTLFVLPVHVFMAVKLLDLPYLYLWNSGKPMILSTICMISTIFGTKWILEISSIPRPAIVDLVFFTLLGIIIYMLALWTLDKEFVLQVRDLAKKAFGG